MADGFHLVGHPLIHLGYAYEMDNKELAIEALGLGSVQYNFLHKYIDDPSYTRPPPPQPTITTTGVGSAGTSPCPTPLELLGKMSRDERLKHLFPSPGFDNFEALFEKHEDLVLEYWNAWTPGAKGADPLSQFGASQEAAVALLVATVPPGTHSYNFFVVHLLTTSHAVRVLLPVIPAKFHVGLVRQWWLLAVAVYMARLCPVVDPDYIRPGEVKGKFWDHVEDRALNGPYATDSHFVKGMDAFFNFFLILFNFIYTSTGFSQPLSSRSSLPLV